MQINPDPGVLVRPVEEWTMIIDAIKKANPDVIKLRDTDHEYRTDDRDITGWKGERINKSIDGLPYNIDQDVDLITDLLNFYFNMFNKEQRQ